jgi:16S rRNA processing protein RimM
MKKRELIKIGEITKPQGLKGHLRVKSFTDIENRFENLKKVFLEIPGKKIIEEEIEEVANRGSFIVIKLKNYNFIDEAEKLRQTNILIDKNNRPALEKNQYYTDEILGLKVYTEKKVELGEVVDILPTGSNDIYVVKGRNKEILVPATKEIVKKIDLEKKEMIIELIKGLI